MCTVFLQSDQTIYEERDGRTWCAEDGLHMPGSPSFEHRFPRSSSENRPGLGIIIDRTRRSGRNQDFTDFIANAPGVFRGCLKTALSGPDHAIKFAKYARRYLAEAQYRFNRRTDLAAMMPRLVVAVTKTRPCPKQMILGKAEERT